MEKNELCKLNNLSCPMSSPLACTLLFLCFVACAPSPRDADATWKPQLDTLLQQAPHREPEALAHNLRSFPSNWIDSFFHRRLRTCYQVTDVSCMQANLRQYALLRPDDAGSAAVRTLYEGNLHQWAGRYDSAEVCYAQAAYWFEAARDTPFLNLTLAARSGNFSVLGQLEKDIQIKYRVLALCKPGTEPFRANRSMLANSLVKNGDYEQTLALLPPDSVQVFATTRDTIGWAYALTVLGNTHIGKQQYPQALSYLRQALHLRIVAQKIPLGMKCESYYLYGRCLGKMNRWEEALDTLKVGERLGEKMPNKQGLTLLYLSLGEAFLETGAYIQAETYLRRSLEISMARKQIPSAVTASALLARTQKQQGKTHEALLFWEQHLTLKDTLFNREKEKIAQAAAAQYETREQAQRIETLQIQNRLAKQRNWWIAGSLTLLFGLLSVWIRLQKQRQLDQLAHQKALMDAQNAVLAQQLNYQQRELQMQRNRLNDYAQMLIERNERLAELSQALEHNIQPTVETTAQPEQALYNQRILTDADWEKFKGYFNAVHPDFLSNLRKNFPTMSTGELRLVMPAKMGLNIKETASMLGISTESVKKARYRLKKKFNQSGDELADL